MIKIKFLSKSAQPIDQDGLEVTVLDDGTRIVTVDDIIDSIDPDQKRSLQKFGKQIRDKQTKKRRDSDNKHLHPTTQ